MQNGTVTAHSWNDGAEDDEAEPKMGNRVNDQLKDNPLYYQPSRRNPGRRTPMMFW
jgi:WD repeat-containing protein 23